MIHDITKEQFTKETEKTTQQKRECTNGECDPVQGSVSCVSLILPVL